MPGPGFLERLHRDAHALALSARAAGDGIEAMVDDAKHLAHVAPGAIAARAKAAVEAGRKMIAAAPANADHALHRVEEVPGAIADAGRAALHRIMSPTPHHPVAGHPAAHLAATHPAVHAGPQVQTVRGDKETIAAPGVPFLRRQNESSLVAPSDVIQGGLNDCWLLAALAAMARADPASIEHLIRDLGDHKYEVTLYTGARTKTGVGTPEKFIIDDNFTAAHGKARGARSDVRGALGPELWVRLIEKAMAVKKHGYDGFVALDQGLKARVRSGLDLLQNQGQVDRYTLGSLSEAEVLHHIADGFAHHRPMTSLSTWRPYSGKLKVITFHQYAVSAVDVAKRTVSLQNPWGDHHVNHMPVEDYVIAFDTLELGPKLGARNA
ncbi:MAG: C2 family cysteine protease [Polyangia bacterium]